MHYHQDKYLCSMFLLPGKITSAYLNCMNSQKPGLNGLFLYDFPFNNFMRKLLLFLWDRK